MKHLTNIRKLTPSLLSLFTFAFLSIGMFIIVQPSMGEDGNASKSSSKGGLNRTMQQPRQVPCAGGETVLLIQDAVPWCADANVTELQASGKNFCTITSAGIGTTDLGQFNEILISADQPQTFYDNLFPGGVTHPAIVAWVQNGGILSANLADNGWNSGNWDSYTFIGGLTHVTFFPDDNNIADPNHPIITGTLPCPSGNCGQIVDADLDGWNCSSMGYFINLPPGTTVIIDQPDETGDGIPEPVMIEYSWGIGRVIATMTTTEWRYAGCPDRVERKLLSNEIAYQDFLAPREDCTNGIDDDGDGLVDCADPDCNCNPVCNPSPAETETSCTNGVDDDCDGLVDCFDPDCVGQCPEAPFRCNDGRDNDGDGLVDCADPDCPPCVENCTNGIDDDGDGLIDCVDPDCSGGIECFLECIIGVDFDGDGLVGCLDPSCFGLPSCPEVLCSDGLDNDGDGLVDCDDPNCNCDPVCAPPPPTETSCTNGVDDDCDGLVDCNDPDCFGPSCPEQPFVNCCDGFDNDGDGLVDCADPDCFVSCVIIPICPEVCDDGIDNDGDGLIDCDDPGCRRPEDCSNGVDDDCDGLVDCDDLDCICNLGCASPIGIGQEISGTLEGDDCQSIGKGRNFFADRYSFNALAGQEIAISLTSPDFDTHLFLLNSNGGIIAQNDDGGNVSNSRIPPEGGFFRLPSAGTFIIEVTSFRRNTKGDYTVSLTGPEDCANGIDDDGDGLVDCDDIDCTGASACVCLCSEDSIPPTGCISGIVTNSVGQRLQGKTVVLRRLSPRPRKAMFVITDNNGCYGAADLQDGKYRVRVKRCGGGGTKTVVVTGGGKVNDVDFQCK